MESVEYLEHSGGVYSGADSGVSSSAEYSTAYSIVRRATRCEHRKCKLGSEKGKVHRASPVYLSDSRKSENCSAVVGASYFLPTRIETNRRTRNRVKLPVKYCTSLPLAKKNALEKVACDLR